MDRQKTVLAILPLLKIFVFSIVPMVGIIMAFQRYDARMVFFSPFIGFDNFRFVFESGMIVTLLTNTIILNLLFMVFTTVISITLTLFLFEIKNKFMLKGLQTIFFFPYFIAWPVTGLLIGGFLNGQEGLITNIILNLTGKKIMFYDEPKYWRAILTIVMVWKTCGASSIFNYCFLLGTDQGVYEAARIDGAGVFDRMLFISLPYLSFMIFIGLITSMGAIIRMDLSLIWYTVGFNSKLYPTTDVFETFQMRALFNQARYGQPVAMGLFQGVVGLILSVGANFTIKKINRDASLF